MKIITISREFGSGGRELGKRLADRLGFDYYDREIVTAIAEKRGMDETYLTQKLENHGWKNFPLTFRRSLSGAILFQTAQTDLLLEQKRIIEGIADLGKDFVIVGRSADLLLRDYRPLNLFVCANTETKIRRIRERADRAEEASNLSDKEILKKMQTIDKNRRDMRVLISGDDWGNREQYHLTVNTTDWKMRELSEAVATFAEAFWERTQ